MRRPCKAGNVSLVYSRSIILDTSAPIISDVKISKLLFGAVIAQVTITWTTNEASDSQVEYGMTTAYGSLSSLNMLLVTSHSVSLSNLFGSTLYYRVRSRDQAGNLAVSSDFTFTLQGTDTTAPVISAVTPSNITATDATIIWTTNESSDSQVEYRIQGASTWLATPLNKSLVTNHSVNLTGLNASTTYEYRVKSRDQAGNLATQATILSFRTLAAPDTTPPSGTISINNDARYTNSLSVTLILTGSDTGSGLGQMRFSTDNGSTWTAWENFATTKTVAIPSGDGTKTIQYQLRDIAGNVGAFSNSIILDTIPPAINFTSGTLTNHAAYALTYTVDGTAKSVAETLTVEGINTLLVTETDLAGNSTQSSFNVTLDTIAPVISFTSPTLTNNPSYTLTYTADGVSKSSAQTLTTEGANVLSITETDPAGNVASATYTVTLDTIAPTASMNINSGAAFTNTTAVSLNLSGIDSGSGIDQMSFSTDGINYSVPEAYATSKTFTLPTVDGNKTVYVKYFDKAGNVSLAYSTSIILDTTPPMISAVTPSNITATGATINWTTNEASDTQVEYGMTTAYGSSTTLNTALVTSHSVSLDNLTAGTTYHYQLKSMDAAGNLQISGDFTFTTQVSVPLTMQIVFDHGNGHLLIITKSELERQFGSFQAGSVTAQLTDANGIPLKATMVFVGGDLYIVSECGVDVIGSGTLSLDGRSVSLSVSMVNCELHPPMNMTPTMIADQNSMLALFPQDQVTHRAVQSGNFEDAATWGGVVPTAGSRILIENAVVVVNSQLSQNYKWIFVGNNGALVFNPDVNTSLTTTTIGIGDGGEFFMGTTGNPIASNATARLQFTPRDSAAIIADTKDLGGGFLSAHGSEVSIHGAVTTSGVNAAVLPQAGSTQISLSQVPTNWRVGGRIVLPAASDTILTVNLANEEFVITAISADGRTITLDHAIMRTPSIPSNFSYPIIYTDRNVQFSSTDTSTRLNRAHMMFMCPADIEYASLMGVGREDKMRPVTDTIPPTDPNSNQRGRYAIHFHRAGPAEEALVRGVVIRDTPGWQFVNHSSYVRFEENIAIGATGAAFVTEAGDEIGSFIRNIIVGVTGTGNADGARSEAKDYGYRGNGFWFQGTAVNVFENSVWNVRSAGIGIYAKALAGSDKGDPTTIPTAILGPMLDPSIFGGAQFISPTQFPMQIRGNTVVGALQDGIRTYYLGQDNENIRFIIEGNYVANVGERGISTQYATNFDILNNVVDNSMLSKATAAIGWTPGQDSGIFGHITVEGNSFIGFTGGAYIPPHGVTYVRNNLFDSKLGISIANSRSTKRQIYIENNTFGPNTVTKIDLTYQDSFSTPDRNMFDQDQILYTEAGQPTVQLFFREQAASFAPFNNTGTILDGLTNDQIRTLYGLTIGGALLPSDAVYGTAQKINAYIGSPVSFVRPLYYPTITTNATYTPKFSAEDKTVVYEGSPVTLHPGINVIPTGGIDPLTGLPLTAIVNYVTSNVTNITLQIPTELSTAVVSSQDTSIFISVKAIFTREGGVDSAVNFNQTVPLIHLGNGTAVANFMLTDPITGAQYWRSIIFTESSSIPKHLYPDWWRL